MWMVSPAENGPSYTNPKSTSRTSASASTPVGVSLSTSLPASATVNGSTIPWMAWGVPSWPGSTQISM